MSALEFGLTLQLIDQFTAPARAAAKAFKNVSDWATNLQKNPPDYSATIRQLQAIQDNGKKTRELGQGIAVAGGSALFAGQKMAGAIGDIAGAANSFEKTLTMVGTVAPQTFGSVQADMAAVKKSAMEWSAAHSDSAEEYTRTSYMMISAGLKTDQAIVGTEVALSVATATMGEGTEAAALLATMYNNIGDQSKDLNQEMTRLGDVVTKTQQTFQFANLGQLNEGFKYALPVSKQYRMELNETAAVIGQLNSAGIVGGQAGTAFRASMYNMSKAAKDLGFEVARTASGGTDFLGTLENIKAKFGTKLEAPDTQDALQKAFGSEGYAAIGVLLGQTDKLAAGIKAVGAGAGSTAGALAMMDATGAGAMDRLTNATTNAKVALGSALAPALLPLIQAFGSIATAISSWATENPRLAATLGVIAIGVTGLTIVMGALLTGIGMATMGWGSLQVIMATAKLKMLAMIPSILATNAALLANPIVWVVAGVLALGLAIYGVIKYWDQIKAAATIAINWISDKLTWVWNWIKTNWPMLLPLLLGPFAPLAYAVMAIIKYWDQIKAAAAFALGWIVGKAQMVWNWVKTNWPYLAPILLGPFAPVGYAILAFVKNFDTVKAAVLGVGEAIWGIIKKIISVFQAVPKFLAGAPGKILEYFTPNATSSGKAFADTFAEGVRAGTPSATTAVAGLTNQVDQYMPHSDAAVGPLSRLTESGRAFSKTFATGIEDGATYTTDSISGILQIPNTSMPAVLPTAPTMSQPGPGDLDAVPGLMSAAEVTMRRLHELPLNTMDDADAEDFATVAARSLSGLMRGLSVPEVITARDARTPAEFIQPDEGRQRRPSISIANLVINVQAKDVREAEDLGDLLQGLAMEVG